MPNNNRLQPIWAGLARNNRWSRFIHEEDVHTFSRRMESEGPEFYARGLHTLRAACLTGIETGTIGDVGRFGLKQNSRLPRFMHGVISSIFDKDGDLLPSVDVDAVACVNQLTAVFTKLKGGHTPQSEKTVIESFVKTEEELSQFEIDGDVRVPVFGEYNGKHTEMYAATVPLETVLLNASKLVKRVLSGSDPREISPSHGSGVSACGTPLRARYTTPQYIDKINRIWDMSAYYFASPTAFCDKMDEYMQRTNVDPCAKVLLVPKDARGPRLISCEPKETMWIQQGLMDLLYRTIEGHPLTRGCVNFTHQWINQLAARDGSFAAMQSHHTIQLTALAQELSGLSELTPSADRSNAISEVQALIEQLCNRHARSKDQAVSDTLFPNYPLQDNSEHSVAVATLDLKDASDRLSLDLVKRLYPRNWVAALEACRSESTRLPDGRLVAMCKHAPMGSAVCFPVMALTIWSLLTAIAPRCSHEHILVYGDDIVVPTYLVPSAMLVLESVGLLVNRSKSFTRGLFRESCGEEYYAGCRITPVRLRAVPNDDVESMMSCMAFSNNMLKSPYLEHNHDWFIELMQEWYGKKNIPVLLDVPSSPYKGIWSETDHCLRIKRQPTGTREALSGVAYTNRVDLVNPPSGRDARYNKQLNCWQYRIRVPVPRTVRYGTSDWCHVLRALTRKGVASMELGSDPIHNRVRYLRRWISSNR